MGMHVKCSHCKSNIEYLMKDVSYGYAPLTYMPVCSIKCPQCGTQILVDNPMHSKIKLNI